MTNGNHYWQVEASIYGGAGYAPATRKEYAAIAKSLESEAAALEACAASWDAGALQLQAHYHQGTLRQPTLTPRCHMRLWEHGALNMRRCAGSSVKILPAPHSC